MVITSRVRLTYKEYRQFPNDGKRHELIDGDHLMTPSPIAKHQRASLNLAALLKSFVEEHKLGEVFDAPFDVILSDSDVVEPDILFISAERLKTLVKDWVYGAPDLVVEILSPSTEEIDRTLKMKLYEKYGVREYWIVDPDAESIEVYALRRSGYKMLSRARKGQHARSEAIEGFVCDTEKIFKTK